MPSLWKALKVVARGSWKLFKGLQTINIISVIILLDYMVFEIPALLFEALWAASYSSLYTHISLAFLCGPLYYLFKSWGVLKDQF